MGGGIVQPRSTNFDPKTVPFAALELPVDSSLPAMVVLDLDNTVWTPELFTLRKLPRYADAGPPGPIAGQDVWLVDGAAAALNELATCDLWRQTKVAVASRTNKAPWAHQLLSEFQIAGRPIVDMLSHAEIYPGSKTKHFAALHEATGIPFASMIFFDDSADGKYGNCEPISKLGVLAVHCPNGLTTEVWRAGISAYARLVAAGEATGRVLRPAGCSAPSSGSIAAPPLLGKLLDARVVKFMESKGFGFVQIGETKREVFFHESRLPRGATVRPGARVTM